jgi:hypothetical protein
MEGWNIAKGGAVKLTVRDKEEESPVGYSRRVGSQTNGHQALK